MGGQVSLFRLFCLTEKLLDSAEMTPSFLLPFIPEGSLLINSHFLPHFHSHNIPNKRIVHAHFPTSSSTSIFLLQGEARQDWGDLGRSFKAKPWSPRGVCVKAGVCNSGQRGHTDWALLGVEGML